MNIGRSYARIAQRLPLGVLFAVVLFVGVPAPGQESSSPADSTFPSANQQQLRRRLSTSGSADIQSRLGQGDAATTSSEPFSADELIDQLRLHPEAMPATKRLVAKQLSQQGEVVSPDELTDEDVYDEIESDADLRATLTRVIHSRESSTMGSTNVVDDPLDGAATGQDASGAEVGAELASDRRYASTTAVRDRRQLPNRSRRLWRSTNVPQPDRPNDVITVHKPNPYAGLQSLRDLYTQVTTQNQPLSRFGMDFFDHPLAEAQSSPTLLDLPVGPDYVLGPGDRLTLSLSGGYSRRFPVLVDAEGRIPLMDAGMLLVAGKTIDSAQKSVEHALTPYYNDVAADISLSRVRNIRVYVVGDVQHPGAYDVSSLSTALNALYEAGGPTSNGSLRDIKQYRGKRLVADIDLYDFLLRGIRSDVERLESGDTILVPPVGPQISVAGMVRRPAIYEIRNEKDLADVLDLAGGLRVSATLQNIKLERTEAHQRRAMLSLDLPDGSTTKDLRKVLDGLGIQDGDRLTISSIPPSTSQVVYLQGHVTRPGKYPFQAGMDVGQIIRSYADVLPEPADHAEIVRLDPPDFRPRVIDFDLRQILDKTDPIELKPLDTIHIYGRYEMDAPKVRINGEVLRPGEYPLAEHMTVADLVRMAGGFTRSALTDTADVASYIVENGRRVRTEHTAVHISKAMAGDRSADIKLKAGDVVSIRQLAGWSDIGASITINGEVRYPGAYSIEEGERLSSVIKRAGGFRETAYPAGAMLERVEVREFAEKSRQELIHRIESEGPSIKLVSGLSGQEQAAAFQLMAQQQQQALNTLRQQPVTGRLVIKISSNIPEWENTAADIEMRPGDQLIIPKRPNFVLVNGQVYSPSAITYAPRKSVEWYLRQAGGPTDFANRSHIFVIRANGAVVAGENGSGFWKHSVLDATVLPGDTIVIPEKVVGGSPVWKSLLNTAQFTSSLALAARVVTSF